MIKSFRKVYPLYVLIDFIFINLIFYTVYFFKFNSLRTIFNRIAFPDFQEYVFTFILWTIFIIIFFKRRNLYSTDRGITIPKEIARVIFNIFYSSILIGAVVFFAQYKFFSRTIFLQSSILLCLFLSVWRVIKRLILRKLISDGFHNKNVLIIGAGRVGKAVLEEIRKMPWWGFKVIGFLDDNVEEAVDSISVLGKIKDFFVISKKYFVDEVIVTIPSEKKIVSDLIKQVRNMRLGLRIVPENFEEPLPLLSVDYLGVLRLLTYKERRPHPAELALKRVFDFFVSLILLIIISPIVGIIAVFIKLDSPGTVFFVQKRMGYKGIIFNFYKFRSMVESADRIKSQLLTENEVKDGVIFKIKKDPRITMAGCFLRKYSLDELPQLFNVLKGDMSLIGPRPFPVEESKQFNHDHIPRLDIRPGITGLAQVRGRSDLSFNRWVKWDLWYINNWSFGLDLRILWWTIPVVLKGKGAY